MDRATRQRCESLARTLRYILGVAPDEYGLVPDPEGWCPLKNLALALAEDKAWPGMTPTRLADLAWQMDPCPFEFDDKRVRLVPDPEGTLHPPQREQNPPPTLLYYGSRRKPYAVHRRDGIQPANNEEIVLAREAEMALRIARRREPKPILLEVNTRIAEARGTRLLSYGSHLFVANMLPPEALFGPPPKEELEDRPVKKPKPAKTEGPRLPSLDSLAQSSAWNPAMDRLIARDPEAAKQLLKRRRERKRVDWKDAARKEKRRGN
ncbi:MAG: hypothetical protein HUU16_11235 [Candidatus Omnitrophica bacterium]|nr:hypothetical protein [Candidatus Omnitrophota bacterium]